jgi:hypothetical protein
MHSPFIVVFSLNVRVLLLVFAEQAITQYDGYCVGIFSYRRGEKQLVVPVNLLKTM